MKTSAHAIPDDGPFLKPAAAAAHLQMPLSVLRRIASGNHGLTALRYDNGRLIGFFERHLDDWKQQHLTVHEAQTRARQTREVDRWAREHLPRTLFFPV